MKKFFVRKYLNLSRKKFPKYFEFHLRWSEALREKIFIFEFIFKYLLKIQRKRINVIRDRDSIRNRNSWGLCKKKKVEFTAQIKGEIFQEINGFDDGGTIKFRESDWSTHIFRNSQLILLKTILRDFSFVTPIQRNFF